MGDLMVLQDIISSTQPQALIPKIEKFENLVREHQKSLYNIAFRMTGNAQDAQDLTQDALVRAYKAFDSYKFGTSFTRWLHRIITNLYIDQLRKKKRAPAIEYLDERIEVHDGTVSKEIKDVSFSPESVYLKTQMNEVLQKALEKISPEFRMAIILCDVEGFSYEEIANIMNTSIGTVRSRIHRARHSLRKLLTAGNSNSGSEVNKQ